MASAQEPSSPDLASVVSDSTDVLVLAAGPFGNTLDHVLTADVGVLKQKGFTHVLLPSGGDRSVIERLDDFGVPPIEEWAGLQARNRHFYMAVVAHAAGLNVGQAENPELSDMDPDAHEVAQIKSLVDSEEVGKVVYVGYRNELRGHAVFGPGLLHRLRAEGVETSAVFAAGGFDPDWKRDFPYVADDVVGRTAEGSQLVETQIDGASAWVHYTPELPGVTEEFTFLAEAGRGSTGSYLFNAYLTHQFSHDVAGMKLDEGVVPETASGQVIRSQIERHLGREDEAAVSSARAVQLGNTASWSNAAQGLLKAGKLDGFQALTSWAAETSQPGAAWLQYAVSEATGQPSEAARELAESQDRLRLAGEDVPTADSEAAFPDIDGLAARAALAQAPETPNPLWLRPADTGPFLVLPPQGAAALDELLEGMPPVHETMHMWPTDSPDESARPWANTPSIPLGSLTWHQGSEAVQDALRRALREGGEVELPPQLFLGEEELRQQFFSQDEGGRGKSRGPLSERPPLEGEQQGERVEPLRQAERESPRTDTNIGEIPQTPPPGDGPGPEGRGIGIAD